MVNHETLDVFWCSPREVSPDCPDPWVDPSAEVDSSSAVYARGKTPSGEGGRDDCRRVMFSGLVWFYGIVIQKPRV